jgi:hypothetical protein
MADPSDMIIPMLREMRAEMKAGFDHVNGRFDTVDRRLASLEAAQASFKQALSADSLLSKLVTGEFEGHRSLGT